MNADLISFAADQLLELQRCGFNVAALTLIQKRETPDTQRLSPSNCASVVF